MRGTECVTLNGQRRHHEGKFLTSARSGGKNQVPVTQSMLIHSDSINR